MSRYASLFEIAMQFIDITLDNHQLWCIIFLIQVIRHLKNIANLKYCY